MLVVTANYSDDKNVIKLSREVADDANLAMVAGEVLYGVEVQVPEMFNTGDEFKKAEIPAEFKSNCTVLNVEADKFTLKMTICRGKKK